MNDLTKLQKEVNDLKNELRTSNSERERLQRMVNDLKRDNELLRMRAVYVQNQYNSFCDSF